MSLGSIALVLLLLSPLIYATDSGLRSYEVIAVAIASGALLLLCGVRGVRKWDVILVALFCAIVIIQQMAIRNGSLSFGAQYAIVMASMFVPAWGIQAAYARLQRFEQAASWTMSTLWVILAFSIYTSFVFGVGEVFTAEGPARAFAWLGDSITPVLVLPIIFFLFQRKWVPVVALLGALYMTGGKAATVMLCAAALIYAFVSPMTLRSRFSIALLVAVPVLLGYFYWETILSEVIPGVARSYHNRAISFGIGLQYFQDSPWFGVGINQSYQSIEQESQAAAKAMGIEDFYPVYRIHNAFLRTAAETGIAGLAVFLALCGLLLARSARAVAQAYSWQRCLQRSLVITGGLWTMSFIVVYQSTGWFEAGHPQLAWLLIIATVTDVTYRRFIRAHHAGSRPVASIAASVFLSPYPVAAGKRP